MPILDVEIVGEPPAPRTELAQKLADAAGRVLHSRPQGTWVKVRALEPEDYAENGGTAPGLRPVFVSITLSQVPAGRQLEDQVAELTRAIAAVCDRPADHVHLFYQPAAKGRVAFGGRLVGSLR